MAIKLRVISDQYRELGENRSRVFGVNGGTIGRAPDNDWVLPDRKRIISGHHCEIEFRNGTYWLRDTSTNGVFVNDHESPASQSGPIELQDGDRLRLGEYELLVSVDARIDFLPNQQEEYSAAKHLDSGLAADLDVDSLFRPRDPDPSGSVSVRNAFGLKVPRESMAARTRGGHAGTAAAAQTADTGVSPVLSDSPTPATPDWALSTRAITRQELADAMARRQSRLATRLQTQPFHQQAATWTDLRSAVQAFCRGAGIDPAALSPEAQTMLPLVAGQLLREAVVGLHDLAQTRASSGLAPPVPPSSGASNPLRSSSGVDEALLRLFESHGRVQSGPVDALRDVLQEARDHEIAMQAGVRAGLEIVLAQLSPENVEEQFGHGRARALAPGQDPAPKYWEHYADLHHMLMQNSIDGMPHPFAEEFAQAYARAREDLRAGRREGESGG
jgi:type VI secretion system FHA domain protein